MPKAVSSRGGFVNYEVRGLPEVRLMLQAIGKDINGMVDRAVLQQGVFIEEELRESIAGNRAEHKSVDTGKLVNDIEVDKVGEGWVRIAPRGSKYPNGQDTRDVAKFMEFGTTHITPRRHFRNTISRNNKQVAKAIEKAAKLAVTLNKRR